MRNGARLILILVATSGVASGQLGAPRVALRTLLESDGAHPGSTVRAALEVRLPKGYHVNSNQPLDKYLIPTTLSLQLPEGVVLGEIVYPEALNLTLEWSEKPLAVYEEIFFIGVAVDLGDDLPPGEHVIEGRLRYQACDDKRCFRPITVGCRSRAPCGIQGPKTYSPEHRCAGIHRLPGALGLGEILPGQDSR